MVQQIFTLVPRLNPSLCFVTEQEVWSTENTNNKRLLQQPALGAITFLRNFVAGKVNFCSQLLASLVHFTVVKSQAILTIRLGVTEVISAVTLYLLPASKRRNFYLVGYVQAQQFCLWTLYIDRRFDSNDVSV